MRWGLFVGGGAVGGRVGIVGAPEVGMIRVAARGRIAQTVACIYNDPVGLHRRLPQPMTLKRSYMYKEPKMKVLMKLTIVGILVVLFVGVLPVAAHNYYYEIYYIEATCDVPNSQFTTTAASLRGDIPAGSTVNGYGLIADGSGV